MANKLTLLELAKRTDPQGATAVIAEVMSEENEIVADAVWTEANNTTTHKVVCRNSLPTGSLRGIGMGVPISASETTETNEQIAMLEDYSEVDKQLADMAPDPQQFRMTEAKGHIEGISQTLAGLMIYGDNSTNLLAFTGLEPRLNELGDRVISCGGSGSDLTSVYVVQWELAKVYMVYPKNSKTVGIDHSDLGQVTLFDANGGRYEGYRDHFKVLPGMAVQDLRCIGRLCNIEVTGTTNLLDDNLLIKLLNEMPGAGKNATIYVNKDIKTQMDVLLNDKANTYYNTSDGLGGVPVTMFRGHPVHLVEQILNTETAVS